MVGRLLVRIFRNFVKLSFGRTGESVLVFGRTAKNQYFYCRNIFISFTSCTLMSLRVDLKLVWKNYRKNIILWNEISQSCRKYRFLEKLERICLYWWNESVTREQNSAWVNLRSEANRHLMALNPQSMSEAPILKWRQHHATRSIS